MKRLLAVAVAIATVTMFCQSDANAQAIPSFATGNGLSTQLNNGFQFGTGLRSARGFNNGFRGFSSFGGGFGGGLSARDDLPYFAKFPPVYYSNIVARPVGISPFAAPPGIRPIELNYAPVKQVTKKNPFYNGKALPVKSIPAKLKAMKEKTTWIPNPYLGTVVVN